MGRRGRAGTRKDGFGATKPYGESSFGLRVRPVGYSRRFTVEEPTRTRFPPTLHDEGADLTWRSKLRSARPLCAARLDHLRCSEPLFPSSHVLPVAVRHEGSLPPR